jgi:Glycosyltransferase family 87
MFFWIVGSWACFYAALRLAKPNDALLLSLATPAVLVNTFSGQNGAWTAALFGGGLCLLERRPVLAGVLFGLLAYKPQIAILIPIALLAGRQWRALAAASATVITQLAATVLIFGFETWVQHLRQAEVLKAVILEGDDIFWRRMMSVFIFVHRLGFDIATSYALQAVSGLLAAAIVALAWFQNAPARLRYALLVLGTCLATPYLQDYDFVFTAFLVAWLVRSDDVRQTAPPAIIVALGFVLAAPLLESAFSKLIGLGSAPLFTGAAFFIVTRMAMLGNHRSADDQHCAGGPAAEASSMHPSEMKR